MKRSLIKTRRVNRIRHQQRGTPVFEAVTEKKGHVMRKILLIIVVITVGAPVLRATMATDLDSHVQRSGWTIPGLGMNLGMNLGGVTGASILGTITETVMGKSQTAPPPRAAAPSAIMPQAPLAIMPQAAPGQTAARPSTARGPAEAAGKPAPASPGLARGAEGVVTPELLKLLNPRALSGQPGGTRKQDGTLGPETAASTDPAPRQMLQTLAEQVRSNPAAFRDQLGAVNRALGGK